MRQLMRCLSVAALAIASLAWGAEAADCRKNAVEKLRASAPDGYAIYQQMKDKKFFLHWTSCDDVQYGLPTAVHESVHYLTADADAFPLVDGGQVERPHEVSRFFPPSRIAAKFKADDFVSTYLKPGRASSSSDFLYLLDELNAYTHDLKAAVDLIKIRQDNETADSRDGLAALMAFVALYIEEAEANESATWKGLQKPEVAMTVTQLWGHAEKVMASSCGIDRFGSEDKTFIRQICSPGAEASLKTVIGRAPVCPTECLNAVSNDGQQFEAADTTIDPAPAARTIWRRRIKGRGSPSGDSGPDDGKSAE